jgi:uncharacterized membrane protein YwaF
MNLQTKNVMTQFGTEHLIMLLIVVVLIFWTIKYYYKLNLRFFGLILFIFQCVVWVDRVINPTTDKYIFKIFDLDICGLIIYALFIFIIKPNKICYQFILFIGPFGTVLAMIFPRSLNFPALTFWTYFITHITALLSIIIIFLSYKNIDLSDKTITKNNIFVHTIKSNTLQNNTITNKIKEKYKITFKTTINVLITIIILAIISELINLKIGSNFMFLNGGVGIKTPLDAFSSNPWIKLLEVAPIFYIVELIELKIYKTLC